jgi:membrane carboxypeptidase/penicillin-binding protein
MDCLSHTGGGEVTVMEMAEAFSVFANNGKKVEPVAITRIEDHVRQCDIHCRRTKTRSGHP